MLYSDQEGAKGNQRQARQASALCEPGLGGTMQAAQHDIQAVHGHEVNHNPRVSAFGSDGQIGIRQLTQSRSEYLLGSL